MKNPLNQIKTVWFFHSTECLCSIRLFTKRRLRLKRASDLFSLRALPLVKNCLEWWKWLFFRCDFRTKLPYVNFWCSHTKVSAVIETLHLNVKEFLLTILSVLFALRARISLSWCHLKRKMREYAASQSHHTFFFLGIKLSVVVGKMLE